MSSDTLIVIPTYNERDCLPEIVPAVRAVEPQATILVVDDNSPDGTGALADEMAARDAHIRVLHRQAKRGLGAAYIAAFQDALDAGGRWKRVVQMDADLSHDPKDVPRLLRALADGADLAVGSRYVEGGGTENWGLGRQVISRGGGLYARTVLGVTIQDLTAGFKAWKIETLRRINLQAVNARGYGFQIEMTYRTLRNGMRVVEVPIRFVDRRVGNSKMSRSIVLEALTLVWGLRRRIRPGQG
ncbi:MAG TPA: polyprenol monophosphomannose synthase [Polyangia bacterium]|jgi:dolichol-phosphate mannosyltransferase|nr:polyprenol monophosphomannose synthase [Polyangia bacterium]